MVAIDASYAWVSLCILFFILKKGTSPFDMVLMQIIFYLCMLMLGTHDIKSYCNADVEGATLSSEVSAIYLAMKKKIAWKKGGILLSLLFYVRVIFELIFKEKEITFFRGS